MALHELRHVEADHRFLTAKEVSGQSALVNSVLPTPVGTGEDEAGNRDDSGFFRPTRARRMALDTALTASSCPIRALVQRLLHVEQLDRFTFGELSAPVRQSRRRRSGRCPPRSPSGEVPVTGSSVAPADCGSMQRRRLWLDPQIVDRQRGSPCGWTWSKERILLAKLNFFFTQLTRAS